MKTRLPAAKSAEPIVSPANASTGSVSKENVTRLDRSIRSLGATASASDRLPGDLGARGSSAIDGDPGTAWVTPMGGGVGQQLRIHFAEPLDKEISESGDSWAAEQWNYLYGAQYGSKEFSVNHAGVEGHDPIDVKSARLSDDGRSVALEIPSLRPVMQLRLRYSLRAADGTSVKGEIDSTIHRLGK